MVTVGRDKLIRESLAHLVARRKRVSGRKPMVHCPNLAGGMGRQEVTK